MPSTILLHLFSVIMLVKKTLADGFVIPPTWKGTNLTISVADRQSTIEAAIQEVFNNENSLTSASDDFFSILAVYDLYNNQTSFKSPVTAYFTSNPFQSNDFSNIPINQGVDAMRAYHVYENPAMLDIATQAWDYGRTFTISDANVATSSIPSKSFNFTKTCSGSTLVGGTFWQTGVNNTNIFGVSTALFFTLSAYLYQATSNNTYLDAAQQSGAFMIDIMHITGVNNGNAAMSVNDSASCDDVFGPGDFRIDHAGIFMEGLALLPSNTSFGQQNLSVETLRSNLVNITLTTNVLCNAANGIINVGGGLGDAALVQGLGALYHTISGPTDLITYIGNFLSVQYNTLVTASTVSNSNIYAGSWIGPPVTQYDPTNQTLALFALVNAAQVSVTNQTNSTTNGTNSGSTTTGTTSPGLSGSNSNHHPTSHIGLIVGAVVGGLVLLTAIALLTLYTTRGRRQQVPKQNVFHIDAFYPDEVKTHTFPPIRNTSRIVPSAKQRRWQVVNQNLSGPSTDSSLPGQNTNSNSLEQVPITDLLHLLQARIQQERRSEQGAAPAYEVPVALGR